MKSYTDINQSRKLAEIFPIESADMVYIWHATSNNPAFRFDEDMPPMVLKDVPISEITADTLPCWSLAALLDVLPDIHLKKYIYDGITKYYATLIGIRQINSKHCDNPVDACYEMILKLKENNLL